MEPFRHLVERQALTLLRRRELKPDDFTRTSNGGCRLSRPALRLYLAALSTRCISPLQGAGSTPAASLYQQLWRNARQLIAALRLAEPMQRQPGDHPPTPDADPAPAIWQPFRLR